MEIDFDKGRSKTTDIITKVNSFICFRNACWPLTEIKQIIFKDNKLEVLTFNSDPTRFNDVIEEEFEDLKKKLEN